MPPEEGWPCPDPPVPSPSGFAPPDTPGLESAPPVEPLSPPATADESPLEDPVAPLAVSKPPRLLSCPVPPAPGALAAPPVPELIPAGDDSSPHPKGSEHKKRDGRRAIVPGFMGLLGAHGRKSTLACDGRPRLGRCAERARHMEGQGQSTLAGSALLSRDRLPESCRRL